MTLFRDSGPGRNIYFPFDIAIDTASDVATEMVKELEITEWQPFEIAKMIDEEISNLVPSWKNSTSSDQIPQMQSFTSYEDDDDDDNSPHNPFYSCSSFSSSHDSLPCHFSNYNWLHGMLIFTITFNLDKFLVSLSHL